MIHKLHAVLQEALYTRLAVTGKRLTDIDTMKLDTQSKVVLLRWLIVCRKFDEAVTVLQGLSTQTLPSSLGEEIFSAQLRLFLLDIAPQPASNNSLSHVRWAAVQQRNNTDIAYPTSVDALYITLDSRKKPMAVLSINCPACRTNITVSLRSDIVPFGAAKGTWICPHCLALRTWDADSAKQDCIRQYASIIKDMPRNAQGKLSDVDACQAYILAQKLHPLLHITLEGIPVVQQPVSPDYIVPYACLPHQALLEYLRVSKKETKHEEKIKFSNKNEYIQHLTEKLQAYPFNESVVTELQKCASSPFYKEFYARYLQCIQKNAMPHQHRKRRQQHDTSPMRLTFFAGADNLRVLRLALTAKAAGCNVQVIIQSSVALEAYDCFDSVVYFTNIFTDLQRITEEIDNFNTDCVHAVIQMHVNLLLVALLLAVDVPVIGDAYDMVNIQYKDSAVTHLPHEKRLERLWLTDIAGLCMRAPYLGLIKKAGLKIGRIPAATVYDPLIPEWCNFPQKLRDSDGKFHIMVFGFYRNPAQDTESIEQLLPYLAACNVHVHVIIICNANNILATLHKKFLQKYDCITYHDKMSYPDYTKLLGSMDMLLECHNTPYCPIEAMGYTPNSTPFHFPNKNCDCIENNVLRYVPECMKYSKWLCRKADIGVENSDIEIFNTQFWKNIVYRQHISPNIHLQNVTKMASNTRGRLLNLYSKVIFHTV